MFFLGVIHLTGYLLDDDDNNDELSDISSTVGSLEEEDVEQGTTPPHSFTHSLIYFCCTILHYSRTTLPHSLTHKSNPFFHTHLYLIHSLTHKSTWLTQLFITYWSSSFPVGHKATTMLLHRVLSLLWPVTRSTRAPSLLAPPLLSSAMLSLVVVVSIWFTYRKL